MESIWQARDSSLSKEIHGWGIPIFFFKIGQISLKCWWLQNFKPLVSEATTYTEWFALLKITFLFNQFCHLNPRHSNIEAKWSPWRPQCRPPWRHNGRNFKIWNETFRLILFGFSSVRRAVCVSFVKVFGLKFNPKYFLKMFPPQKSKTVPSVEKRNF